MKTIAEGAQAPDFELPDQDGTPRRLSNLVQGGPVVLFFYPAAFTPGCTKEACHFRDLGADFNKAGVQRIGISADAVEKQNSFSAKHSFDYPLLSDTERTVAESYGVKRSFITPVKRATFVIDPDMVIRKIITSEVRMDLHADEALAAAEGL
jgi:peroxiredoxin Q/BCP